MDNKHRMNNVHIVVVLIVLALTFIEVGHIWRNQVQSRLKQPLVTIPAMVLDWWSLSHFILFGLFGYLVPDRHVTFFTLGVLFELFEDGMSSDTTTQLLDCTVPSIKHETVKGALFCRGWSDSYWYMSMSDPIVNLCGYVLGSAIKTTIRSRSRLGL